MSTVYLAERADQPFRRQVVVKVVRRGMESAETLRRFRVEQQVLASLVHSWTQSAQSTSISASPGKRNHS